MGTAIIGGPIIIAFSLYRVQSESSVVLWALLSLVVPYSLLLAITGFLWSLKKVLNVVSC